MLLSLLHRFCRLSPQAFLSISLLLISSSLFGAVRSVGPLTLSVADLDRQTAFFRDVLAFEVNPPSEAEGVDQDRRFALTGVRTRSARLRLGDERIVLTEFVAPRGRPYPADSRSPDHWFQHIAIVVRDMDAAYAVLVRAKVRHVSTSPQTLPLSNPAAGGIRAFYFQDPEGHVLEVIWFPPGKGNPRWQQPTDRLFLGIDHTAIVVSDTDRSLAFYRDALGMAVAGGAENFDTEQEHLNQVFGARVRITGMAAPDGGPGIEFLEYIAPPGGRPLPADARPNDLLAWRVALTVDSLPATEDAGRKAGGIAVSPALMRDPDGHLVEWVVPKP